MKRLLVTCSVVLAMAVAANAEVSLFIEAPPRPAHADDSALGQFDKDLKMDRNQWIDLLQTVKGSKVSTIKQGNNVSCAADIERRLRIEGYEIIKLEQLNIVLKQAPAKDELIRQAVDALQGHIDRKFAVQVLEALYIAVAPSPNLKKEELKRSFVEMLSGVHSGHLGRVKAYIMREFDLPVGFVCVEMELGKDASFDSVIRLVELSLGALLNNQTKAYDAEFESAFGAAARQLQLEEMKRGPEPKYQWGR